MKQVKPGIRYRILSLLCGIFLSVSAFAQQITVSGHVKDATGEPIIGATIRVVGVTGGVMTDIDGNFSISANADATLDVTYIGYKNRQVKAAPNVVIMLQHHADILHIFADNRDATHAPSIGQLLRSRTRQPTVRLPVCRKRL